MVAVEDLYRPYRPKRRTRAMIAKEKGLEPLADLIWLQQIKEPVEGLARAYVSEEKQVASEAEAVAGARDILAERISDQADYRSYIRKITMDRGMIASSAKDGEIQSVYEMYYQYEELIKRCAGHRILGLKPGRKGESSDSKNPGAGGGYYPVSGKAGDYPKQSFYGSDSAGDHSGQL